MKNGENILFSYTGNPQAFKVPVKGIYKLEVWGAEGGGYRLSDNSNSGNGGRGGYAKGLITLNKGQMLHVYAGGYGQSTSSENPAEGGWNGGGCAWGSSSSEPANGGGGATDIRLVVGSWDNGSGLLSRIIVAGGGGGGGEDTGETGGYGGGNIGGNKYGGTQTSTSGGGAFGKGANTPYDGGGGGGGWFGGGTSGGSQDRPSTGVGSDTSDTASGGSGYVLTASSHKPTGYTPTSDFYMTEPDILTGENTVPSPHGTGTQIGNTANGLARITLIESLSTLEMKCNVKGQMRDAEVMLVKVNGSWREVEQIISKRNGSWNLPK